jgi:hypothetical protein
VSISDTQSSYVKSESEPVICLQLLDSIAVQATMSEFEMTICVKSGLEEVE